MPSRLDISRQAGVIYPIRGDKRTRPGLSSHAAGQTGIDAGGHLAGLA